MLDDCRVVDEIAGQGSCRPVAGQDSCWPDLSVLEEDSWVVDEDTS